MFIYCLLYCLILPVSFQYINFIFLFSFTQYAFCKTLRCSKIGLHIGLFLLLGRIIGSDSKQRSRLHDSMFLNCGYVDIRFVFASGFES